MLNPKKATRLGELVSEAQRRMKPKPEGLGADVDRTTVIAKRDKAPSADEPTPPPHPREFSAERPENLSRAATYDLRRLSALKKKPLKPTTFGQLAGKVYTPDTDDRPSPRTIALVDRFGAESPRELKEVNDFVFRPGASFNRTKRRGDVNLPVRGRLGGSRKEQ